MPKPCRAMGHDEGGRNWARFASLIGTCKMNGVEPYAYLRDLFTRLANGTSKRTSTPRCREPTSRQPKHPYELIRDSPKSSSA